MILRGWNLGRIRSKPRFLALSAAIAFALCGCNSDPGSVGQSTANDVYSAVARLDLSSKLGFPNGQPAAGDAGRPRGTSYFGTGDAPAEARLDPGQQIAKSGDGYEVDFENAPIAGVAKAIIVDALGLSLSVDPRVDGKISLSSGRPLKRDEVLFALEGALRASFAAMVRDGSGYRIIPITDVAGLAGVDPSARPTPGYGISVLPLRFVSADNIVKLVDSFAAKPGSVRIDTSRNLLLVQGSAEERRVTMDAALSFDQDWMRGQSVGVYPVSSAAPETIITELQRITDSGEGGAAKGLVQFQPIARMNAVLVVAKRPDLLRQVATWIQRLDHAENSATLSRVYHVKYGSAKQLAALLNDALGNGSGQSTGNDSLEPGTGRVSLGSTGSQSSTFGSQASSATGANTSGAVNPTPFGALQGRTGTTAPSGNTTFGNSDSGNQAGRTSSLDASSGSRGNGKAHVTADISTNSLLIFADRESFSMIERVLRDLDRPRLQVAIEATIAEVTLNDGLQYGVQYFLKSGDLPGVKADRGSVGLTQLGADALGAAGAARILPGFNFLLGPQSDPRLVIDALSSRTHVKVLSTPSVVVLDNQVASIQVGDQVPIATSQATLVGATSTGPLTTSAFPVANNIDYRNTGVILRVLPRISAQGNVTLEIEQEISNVTNNGSQNSLTPTVSQRQIHSSISVSNGQTVVLAGLISNQETGDREGIPFLSSIELLGDLFAHNQTARNRTELVVFIRPQIISNSLDAQAVAEEMRNKMLLSGSLHR